MAGAGITVHLHRNIDTRLPLYDISVSKFPDLEATNPEKVVGGKCSAFFKLPKIREISNLNEDSGTYPLFFLL